MPTRDELISALYEAGLQLDAAHAELEDGSTATVHPCLSIIDGHWPTSGATRFVGQNVAVKVVDFRTHRNAPLTHDRALAVHAMAATEIAALSALTHVPGVVTLHEVHSVLDPRGYGAFTLLVEQFCTGRDLQNAIAATYHNAYGLRFTEHDVNRWAGDILRLAQGLHAAGFFHRDWKPENLLLSYDDEQHRWNLVLADFGFAVRIADAHLPRLLEGTLHALAPETTLPESDHGNATPQAEIFAIGTTLADLFNLPVPWMRGFATAPAVDNWLHHLRTLNTAEAELLCAMMAPDPSDRWSTADLLAHSRYFQPAPNTVRHQPVTPAFSLQRNHPPRQPYHGQPHAREDNGARQLPPEPTIRHDNWQGGPSQHRLDRLPSPARYHQPPAPQHVRFDAYGHAPPGQTAMIPYGRTSPEQHLGYAPPPFRPTSPQRELMNAVMPRMGHREGLVVPGAGVVRRHTEPKPASRRVYVRRVNSKTGKYETRVETHEFANDR